MSPGLRPRRRLTQVSEVNLGDVAVPLQFSTVRRALVPVYLPAALSPPRSSRSAHAAGASRPRCASRSLALALRRPSRRVVASGPACKAPCRHSRCAADRWRLVLGITSGGQVCTGHSFLAARPKGVVMDRDKFIDALNDDLETEYRSVVQYVQHAAIIKGAEHLATIAELRRHLTQEVSHAQVLAEQVDFLGGVPTTTVGVVEPAVDTQEALKADLRLERSQLERYRERFAQANELGLADVAEALRPLLEQTQEHVRDLRDDSGLTAGWRRWRHCHRALRASIHSSTIAHCMLSHSCLAPSSSWCRRKGHHRTVIGVVNGIARHAAPTVVREIEAGMGDPPRHRASGRASRGRP